MTDTSASVTAIQSWITSVQSAFADVSQQIADSGPTTNFADVLSNVVSVLDAGPSTTASSSSTASTSGVTTGQQALLSSALAQGSPTPSSVVATASSYLGVPYLWGGTTPAGFDCSGFTQYVYGQLGISLPRTAAEQATVGTPVASLADAQPGDLVFFAGSDGTATSPGHVGIYVGNGEMIDAPETGEDVSIQPVGDPVAIRRVLPTETASSSPTTATATAAVTSGTGPSEVPASLVPLFEQAASQYNVPVALLTSVASVESGFNPSAVSSAGAEGLMQLMPSTAAGLDVNPLDPGQAIDGAAQLLSQYLQQYQSTPLALAAYNAGPAAVAQYGGVPPYPQTEAYVQSVMSTMGASA